MRKTILDAYAKETTKKRQSEEYHLCVNIFHALLRILPRHYLVYHVSNEGKKDIIRGAQEKRMGKLAGVPDYEIMCDNGRTVRAEVKCPSRTLSKAQKEFKAACIRLGHEWLLWKTVDEAADWATAERQKYQESQSRKPCQNNQTP